MIKAFSPIKLLLLLICLYSFTLFVTAQKKSTYKPTVIAYFSGNEAAAGRVQAEKLTHIIYSFCHLKGNRLNVDDARDSATIKALVKLKSKNPELKVLLSLGGWGGCAPCSEVFSTAPNRKAFAASVKELNQYFGTDGIDLDWEYPTIPGHPGHRYAPEDKENFTSLVNELRKTMGKKQEISFAAGGFPKFLEQSVDWKKVMEAVNRVNVMTYDLVGGYDTITGHHTPLYSTGLQKESTDQAVNYLISIGVPANKIVIGAAFYARVWENVENINNGLGQKGKFKSFIAYRTFPQVLSEETGYQLFWDSTAHAPYRYNASKKLFATHDDEKSIAEKTRYVMDKKLEGIMFWELTLDKQEGGLLDVIVAEVKK